MLKNSDELRLNDREPVQDGAGGRHRTKSSILMTAAGLYGYFSSISIGRKELTGRKRNVRLNFIYILIIHFTSEDNRLLQEP